MKIPVLFYNETVPVLFQISINSAGEAVLDGPLLLRVLLKGDFTSSKFPWGLCCNFHKRKSSCMRLGDVFQRDKEGIGTHLRRGNVLSGGREGRPIEDDIIAFPIQQLRVGKGFFIPGDSCNSLLHVLSAIAFQHGDLHRSLINHINLMIKVKIRQNRRICRNFQI